MSKTSPRFEFEAGVNPDRIENRGFIRAGRNGEVILIAPRIENSGIIEADDGKLILAAGRKVTFTSLDADGIQFDVQAPEDAVVNLGEVIARRGTVGAFAGTLRNTGTIQAGSISLDAAGRVVLRAKRDITLAAGSIWCIRWRHSQHLHTDRR